MRWMWLVFLDLHLPKYPNSPSHEQPPETSHLAPSLVSVQATEGSDDSSNVPGQVSPLASGIRGCSAAEMPEVPKGQGFGARTCWAFPYFGITNHNSNENGIEMFHTSTHHRNRLKRFLSSVPSIIHFGVVKSHENISILRCQ